MSPYTFVIKKYVRIFKLFLENKIKHSMEERFTINYINIVLFNIIFALLLFISCLKVL